MSEKKKRTFIAISVPANIRESLEQTGESLKINLSSKAVRWVKTTNIHLTLRFLGETPGGKIPDIAAGLDKVAIDYGPFELHLDRLGCFPNPRQPRVIWVGLSGDTDHLQNLKKGIGEILLPLGWQVEGRRFHPHLTLGRVNDSKEVIQAGMPWGTILYRGKFPVDAIHLIESQLKPTGAEYSVLHTSILTTSGKG